MQTISVAKAIYMSMHLSIKISQSFSYAYYGYALTGEVSMYEREYLIINKLKKNLFFYIE